MYAKQLDNLTMVCICFVIWQWVVQGAVDVNIGANPSAEGGDEDEGVDDQTVKVVDIVDTFRLQVRKPTAFSCYYLIISCSGYMLNKRFCIICRNNLLLRRSRLSHT
jgi:hypothetical protein